jgi:hypothetical protein
LPPPEDAEVAEPLELETLEIAADDEDDDPELVLDDPPEVDPEVFEPDTEDELDVEPDAPPEAASHLPVAGFGDVPAACFTAQLFGVPPGLQAAHIFPLHL